MPSDLATALISGNAAGLAMDPAMAQIAPQLQLAQVLSQQGTSTAPAHPMQALGRLAQTLAGVKIMHDATGELANVYGNAAESASRTLPEDHPLQTALKSRDPYARMVALQQFPKAMLLMSQPQKLTPGEGAYVGSRATATNLGPVSEPGKVTRDVVLDPRVARVAPAMAGLTAGSVAEAKAPFETGGEGVMQGPQGPVKVPITAATRAAMQPGAAPAAASATLQPSAAPAAASPAPTFAQRFGGVTGTPLPNPAIEPIVKADAEEVKMDREAAAKGQQDMATVRVIHDFLPKVATGWSAETRLEGARILQAAGVPDAKIADFMKTDVASGQILQKKFLELSAGAARGMGAREPGSVIQMFAKAYPNLGTNEQAIRLQTNALYMDRMRSQVLADQKTNFLNESVNGMQATGQYRGLKGFNERFNTEHSAERYLSAAEAMSGIPHAWRRIENARQQQAVIDLIPSGQRFLGPDGKMKVKP